MKFRKILLLLLCAGLLLSVPTYADVMGEPVDGCTAVLAEGAVLTERQYWTGRDFRTEHYLTLTPGGAAVPVAVSGELLWSRRSLTDDAALLEAKGLHVLAGSNGGYFTVSTGEPVGVVIEDGIVRCDTDGLEAVGFRSDGSAVFGNPGLTMQLSDADGGKTTVSALNRVSYPGLRLYTPDCASTVTPKRGSWCVTCEADSALRLADNVNLRVIEIYESSGAAIKIPAGQVLFVMDSEYDGQEQTIPPLFRADAALTLKIGCAEEWTDVESAVCTLYPLLRDGEIVSGLETAAAPRTAIGMKADGSIVLYTLDGRQSGYSAGAGLLDVALRLQELGCVAAGALDGGGSTRMAAQMPGDSSLSTVNRPTENRKVVNYILVATRGAPTDTAEQLTLYPLHINAVSGAEIPLTVVAADRYGYASKTPERVNYAVSGGIGQVRNGTLYTDGTGTGTVTVIVDGVAAGTVPVRVTESPETLELYGEVYGKKTASLTLEPGQEVDLTVRATDGHVLLTGDDSLYEWTLEPQAGTVDETGHIVPADVSGTGMLNVSVGESSVSIPITVWTGVPFRDVSKHADYFDAVKYVYENHIFEGTGNDLFAPETVMNRAMLVTVLWRMCGEPEAAAPAGFTDVAAESWYAPAVAWAAESGLVKGYSASEFGPEDDLTKEQIFTILHRWAGEPQAEDGFSADLENTHDYAREAVLWAMQNGLIVPGESGMEPRKPMSRAAVAEVLLRRSLLPTEETEDFTEKA